MTLLHVIERTFGFGNSAYSFCKCLVNFQACSITFESRGQVAGKWPDLSKFLTDIKKYNPQMPIFKIINPGVRGGGKIWIGEGRGQLFLFTCIQLYNDSSKYLQECNSSMSSRLIGHIGRSDTLRSQRRTHSDIGLLWK